MALEKRPLKISVTRKRLPSLKTCNELPRKDPQGYDKPLELWKTNNEKLLYNPIFRLFLSFLFVV